MRYVQILALMLVVACAPPSFGAAQLAAGAKTSAQPTATNPQQRQIQITFDPDVVVAAQPTVSYAVTSFQLSVKYDSPDVSFKDMFYVAPFQQSTGQGRQTLVNDPAKGVISFVSGDANVASVPAGEDVDIFGVNFILDGQTSFDKTLTFTIFADPDRGDFIKGTDPVGRGTVTTAAADVVPTTIKLSFNEATAATPEPASLALFGVGGSLLLRRRSGTMRRRAS